MQFLISEKQKMPFDDFFGFPISRASGVAARLNAAADVARSQEPRHDEPTCCGERQEPDVGEGWRLLGIGDVLQEGDQWAYRNNPSEWYRLPMHRRGSSDLFPYATYRRRVTPEAPQSRPAEMRETTRAAKEFANAANRLSLENGSNTPDWILGEFFGVVLTAFDSAVNAREKCRGRSTPAVHVESMSITDTWAAEVARLSAENHLLTAEVERLRLLPEEQDALSWCRDCLPMSCQSSAVAQIHSEVCGKMLRRHGGKE